jgi:hypothetical protein
MLVRRDPEVGEAVLDGLIRRALRDWVADAEPSPAVWERIWGRARAWSIRRQRNTFSNWLAVMGQALGAGVDFPVHMPARSSLVALRYDPVAVRPLDYWGMLYRLGW